VEEGRDDTVSAAAAGWDEKKKGGCYNRMIDDAGVERVNE
jgi:hypothetical protein